MNQKICCIFGAGDFSDTHTMPDNAFYIAADGGLKHLEKLNITPDVILGDFDSYNIKDYNENCIVFPKEKDYTDMFLAVKYAHELGYKEIHIYGGLGGKRFDHTFANIQMLEYYLKLGCKVILFGANEVITAISAHNQKAASISFDETNSGYISLFAVGGNVSGLTIKGLKYELENHTLSSAFPLGVSNEFTGNNAIVTFKSGTLLIIFDN